MNSVIKFMLAIENLLRMLFIVGIILLFTPIPTWTQRAIFVVAFIATGMFYTSNAVDEFREPKERYNR